MDLDSNRRCVPCGKVETARAGSIAGDWFHLGRARTLTELNELINSLSVEKINQFVRAHPFNEFNVVTLGPEPLEISHAVSPASIG